MVSQPMMGAYGAQTTPYITYTTPQMPSFTNPLGKQKIEELKKNGNGAVKLQITEEDMNKALCTHRDGNKLELYPTHNPNKPGEMRCRICGAEFVPVENVTQEDINACCEDFHNLMHTCKVLNLDISPKLCQEIFQVLPITDRIPEMYKIAADRFNMYMDPYNVSRQVNPYYNGINLLNNLIGNPMNAVMPSTPMMSPMPMQMMGTPQAMQPMGMTYPTQAPVMGQQPMMTQPVMQPSMNNMMPAMPMMNPMAMQMTANAPGMSNGFGVTSTPINVEPTTQEDKNKTTPIVTKQLQA